MSSRPYIIQEMPGNQSGVLDSIQNLQRESMWLRQQQLRQQQIERQQEDEMAGFVFQLANDKNFAETPYSPVVTGKLGEIRQKYINMIRTNPNVSKADLAGAMMKDLNEVTEWGKNAAAVKQAVDEQMAVFKSEIPGFDENKMKALMYKKLYMNQKPDGTWEWKKGNELMTDPEQISATTAALAYERGEDIIYSPAALDKLVNKNDERTVSASKRNTTGKGGVDADSYTVTYNPTFFNVDPKFFDQDGSVDFDQLRNSWRGLDLDQIMANKGVYLNAIKLAKQSFQKQKKEVPGIDTPEFQNEMVNQVNSYLQTRTMPRKEVSKTENKAPRITNVTNVNTGGGNVPEPYEGTNIFDDATSAIRAGDFNNDLLKRFPRSNFNNNSNMPEWRFDRSFKSFGDDDIQEAYFGADKRQGRNTPYVRVVRIVDGKPKTSWLYPGVDGQYEEFVNRATSFADVKDFYKRTRPTPGTAPTKSNPSGKPGTKPAIPMKGR